MNAAHAQIGEHPNLGAQQFRRDTMIFFSAAPLRDSDSSGGGFEIRGSRRLWRKLLRAFYI
jgi:hypothetical protein